MTENRINRISASDIRSFNRPNLSILKKQHTFVFNCFKRCQLDRLINIGQHEPALNRAIKALDAVQSPIDAPSPERLLKAIRAEKSYLAHACSAARLYRDLLSGGIPKWSFAKGEEAFLFLGLFVDHEIALQFGDRLILKTKPELYRQLKRLMAAEFGDKVDASSQLKGIKQGFETCLSSNFNQFKVWGRIKSMFSIYLKSERFGLERLQREGIIDALGYRVLLTKTSECYQARDMLTQLMLDQGWQLRAFGQNDSIAKPKQNGYRSLHILLCGKGKPSVEIQIRTFGMDINAQQGAAAHSVYKFRRYFHGSRLIDLIKADPFDSWLALQKNLTNI